MIRMKTMMLSQQMNKRCHVNESREGERMSERDAERSECKTTEKKGKSTRKNMAI